MLSFSSPEFISTLNAEVSEALKNQVSDVIKPLEDRIASLEKSVELLQKEVKEEKAKAKETNALTQSGKLNNLLITGIEEEE